jgi:tetratricopeptide (TPR) repeat protein
MHAIRLEARAGDAASIRALLGRTDRVRAREPYLSEARAIAAASGRTRTLDRETLRALDRLPDASLHFVHAITAGFVERPDLAWQAATRLVRPGRPDAVRAEGYAALAHLAVSRGQSRVAAAMLDSLSERNPRDAAWMHGYLAALPYLPRDSGRVADARRQLERTPSRTTSAPLYLELSVNTPVARLIDRYSAALLSTPSTGADVTLACPTLPAGDPRLLCVDLEHGIRAEMLRRAGRFDDALRVLERMALRVPYQLAGRSMYFARTRERYLLAQLLERAGRLDEAYDWYGSVPFTARLDYMYLAPAHLGQARVRERQGDRAAARVHYASALDLLARADGAFAVLRDEAASGVSRTAR